MKKLNSSLIIALIAFAMPLSAQFTIDHGPYLQELTSEGTTIVFHTSQKALSKVEIRQVGSTQTSTYHTIHNGLIEAYNQLHAIRAHNLKPNTNYQYRILSKEIKQFQPYKVSFGDSLTSEWNQFTTIDTKAKTASFIFTTDMHDDNDKLSRLLNALPLNDAQMVFYIGDMMSYFDKPLLPFKSFIDTSVKLFAKEKPFVVVRGNHETRGNMARQYESFVPRQNGLYYGTYSLGETLIIMLDSGEDKSDNHSVYGGLIAFDQYREEQTQWLRKVVKSNLYKKAKHRIVMTHIPPIDPDEDWYTNQEIRRQWMPIFNEAKIDLLICGHTHRLYFLPSNKQANQFPIYINDNQRASIVRVTPKGITIESVDDKGNHDNKIVINK